MAVDTDNFDHYGHIKGKVDELDGWSKTLCFWDRLHPREQHYLAGKIEEISNRLNRRIRQKHAGYAPCEDPGVCVD